MENLVILQETIRWEKKKKVVILQFLNKLEVLASRVINMGE